MLYRAGNEHEDDTFALLFEGVEGAVVIDADDVDAQEWQTMQAVQSGALVIAGGRLPVDHEAHRVGQPDLLVRHGEGYLPIEVKSHKALDRVRKEGTGTALVSDLTKPFLGAAAVDVAHTARKHVGDLLQLAHYRALLDAAGIGSPECFAAGVCGTEGVIVWHDLAEATLPAPEYAEGAGSPAGPMSPLARYELEFAHRLGILAAAEDHLDDGDGGAVAEPIVCDQCDMCRWRAWCGDRLEEVADLSLIAGVGAGRRALYKVHGVGSLHDLAGLDWRTAELVRAKVDVTGRGRRRRGGRRPTPLAEVIANRPKQVEALSALGLHTVADLETIDARTLAVCDAGARTQPVRSNWPGPVSASSPAYRKRGLDVVTVPRARHRGRRRHGEHQRRLLPLGRARHRPRRRSPEPRYVDFRLVGSRHRGGRTAGVRGVLVVAHRGAGPGGRRGRHVPGLLLQQSAEQGEATARRSDRP